MNKREFYRALENEGVMIMIHLGTRELVGASPNYLLRNRLKTDIRTALECFGSGSENVDLKFGNNKYRFKKTSDTSTVGPNDDPLRTFTYKLQCEPEPIGT